MSFENPIDAKRFTYEEWIRFAFDRPVLEGSWYYTEEYEFICDETAVLRYYARLFRDPLPPLHPYSDAQIEQGFWFIASCHLSELLWDENIPLASRMECIEAMPALFRNLFKSKPLDTACFMWWDSLRNFGPEPHNPQIVEAMLHSLEKILTMDSADCQTSALHGLGHLKHPEKERIIRTYLDRNPQLSEDARTYAEAAIQGTVL